MSLTLGEITPLASLLRPQSCEPAIDLALPIREEDPSTTIRDVGGGTENLLVAFPVDGGVGVPKGLGDFLA
jgi:hypothetical protein